MLKRDVLEEKIYFSGIPCFIFILVMAIRDVIFHTCIIATTSLHPRIDRQRSEKERGVVSTRKETTKREFERRKKWKPAGDPQPLFPIQALAGFLPQTDPI